MKEKKIKKPINRMNGKGDSSGRIKCGKLSNTDGNKLQK